MALLDKEKKEIEGVLSNYQDIKSVLCSKDFELEKNDSSSFGKDR